MGLPPNGEDLPQCLRENIVEVDIEMGRKSSISILMKLIDSLPKLQSFSLDVDMHAQCQDDYLLYQNLKVPGLKTLSLDFWLNPPTIKGIQELSDTIASSHTLECVTLKYNWFTSSKVPNREKFKCELLRDFTRKCELHKLVEAALKS